MEIQNQDELPWNNAGIGLRLVVPNVEQKQWMVDRIEAVGKAWGIARRYHSNRKVLNVSAKRSRQGIPIHLSACRPRVRPN